MRPTVVPNADSTDEPQTSGQGLCYTTVIRRIHHRERDGRRGVCFLARLRPCICGVALECDLMPIDLSLVIQVSQFLAENHPSFITHAPHCFAGGHVYSSDAVVDLSSKGETPTLSEESGEVRP